MKIMLALIAAGTLAGCCSPCRQRPDLVKYSQELEQQNLALHSVNAYLLEVVKERESAVFPDAFAYPDVGRVGEDLRGADLQDVICRDEKGNLK